MVMLKKRNLIFLLVIVLLAGIGGSYWYFDTSMQQKYEGGAVLTAAQYDEYRELQQDYEKLNLLKNFIEEYYYQPIDASELDVAIYKGLFKGLEDPYSSYLTKEEYADLMASTTGEFFGIGVTIEPGDDGYINVVAPIDGSPAAKAGVKAGDKIIRVEEESYDADTIDAAVSAMRGESGTKVSITVLRDGKQLDFTLKRAKITTESVRLEVMEDNIGYIRISSFEKNTGSDFKAALKNMESAGVSGLVIDLRGNPGGLVDSAIEVANELIDGGVITYIEDQQGNQEHYDAKSGKTDLSYTVLIDGGSASSSEILAAAIKDHQGGKLVGRTTYGKGVIQRIDLLEDGDATKLTTMQYFSPDGNVIHGKGIEPDVEVSIEEEDIQDDVLVYDRQLAKAVELLK